MTWDEFRERCAANVQKIRDTKDDGVYAKLYAADVERLLMMVGALDRPVDVGVMLSELAWQGRPTPKDPLP